MAITVNTRSDENGIALYSTGQLTSDGVTPAAVVLALGFAARNFKLVVVTGTAAPTIYEWSEGLAQSNCIKTIGSTGVTSLDTTLGPVVTDRTVTIPAGVFPTGSASTFVWQAQG